MDTAEVDVSVKQHHIKAELCQTRARYREGRHLKAVKVYTVNQESKYLLVHGIPSVGVHEDLIRMLATYGHLAEHTFLDEYPTEKFTEVLLIKYKQIQAARLAKRKLDDFNFYGGTLHVCYAPEYESVQETREKLGERRKAISARIRKLEEEKLKAGHAKEENGKPVSRQTQHKPPWSYSDAVSNEKSHDVQTSLPGSQHYLELHKKDSEDADLIHATDFSNVTGASEMFKEEFLNVSRTVVNCPVQNTSDNFITPSAKNVYPSQDQDNYRGPHQKPPTKLKYQPEKSNDSQSEKLIVKPFKSKTTGPPKFVPRQVNRTKTFVNKTGKRKTEVESGTGDTTASKTDEDPINERLRSDALRLGKPAGPDLPAEEAAQRQTFKRALTTGDEALEKTVMEIRDQVKKFCEIAVPLQVKKKKKR